MTSPLPCGSGCRHWPSALGRQTTEAVPRWLARLAAGEPTTAMMTEARGLERQGQAPTRLAAPVPQLAAGLHQGDWAETMSGVTNLEELRPPAFAVAYRMLGRVSEAEDIVQEALLRMHLRLRQGERIESPRAYVSTVVTRLCIDQLRSARVRRESYVGEWLPEPLVDDGRSDPAGRAEVADSLSLAFLVLLESLTPEQRAAFLLREVFDYPYRRSPPSSAPARTTPDNSCPGHGSTWMRVGPASRRHRSGVSSWRAASLPPSEAATW